MLRMCTTFVVTLVVTAYANPLILESIAAINSNKEHTHPPPLFLVKKADTLYHAGLQHGQLAKDLIQNYLKAVGEMIDLKKWIDEDERGRKTFQRLVNDNEDAFPQYVEEMRGISDGAEVPMRYIWMVNLLQELSNDMRTEKKNTEPKDVPYNAEHCSDFMAEMNGTIFHGHNEDWSNEVRPFVYFVSYQPSKDASFMPVLGMNYPGMIIGNAITFNPYGIAYTQNALTPQHSRVSGLASNFIQRLCVEKRSFDECMTVLAMAGQTMGYSLNVVSAREGLACNVEDTYDIAMLKGNLSHFNAYKHLRVPSDMKEERAKSTDWRQKRADELLPVASDKDIISRLGDTEEKHYPIYTPTTLVSYILDASTGTVKIWANSNPAKSDPVYTWNVYTFFDY